MPLTEKGQKIMANMQREYGPKKGEQVFYASRNKGIISGVDPGHARGGIVEHDLDPDLPRRQDDAVLVPLATYPPAYLETIERLRQNQARSPGIGEPRRFQAGGSAEKTKYTPEQVNYRRGYPMRQCSVCTMYTHKPNEGAYGGCTDVSGPITPYGLCDIWHCEQNPYGHRLTAQHRRVMEDAYDHAHGYSTSKFSHNRR